MTWFSAWRDEPINLQWCDSPEKRSVKWTGYRLPNIIYCIFRRVGFGCESVRLSSRFANTCIAENVLVSTETSVKCSAAGRRELSPKCRADPNKHFEKRVNRLCNTRLPTLFLPISSQINSEYFVLHTNYWNIYCRRLLHRNKKLGNNQKRGKSVFGEDFISKPIRNVEYAPSEISIQPILVAMKYAWSFVAFFVPNGWNWMNPGECRTWLQSNAIFNWFIGVKISKFGESAWDKCLCCKKKHDLHHATAGFYVINLSAK